DVVEYSQHKIEIAEEHIDRSGKKYVFVEWSDKTIGNERPVHIGDSDETITAIYKEEQPTPPPTPPKPSEKWEIKPYSVAIDSYPQQGVQIKFYYHEKKNTEPSVSRTDFNNTVNSIRTPSTKTAIMNIAAEFEAEVKKIHKKEDAEKWLKNRLRPITGDQTEAWIELIIEAFWIEQPGFKIKEISIGNNKTPIYVDLNEGIWILEAPEKVGEFTLNRWEATAPDGTKIGTTEPWELDNDNGPKLNKLRLVLDANQIPSLKNAIAKGGRGQPIKVTVNYSKSTKDILKFEDRRFPGQKRGRQGNALNSNFITGTFGAAGLRGKISRDVTPRKLKTDPHLLAAVNKGKRLLNKYAKAEYSKIFDPKKREFKERAAVLRQKQRAAVKARVILRGIITANLRHAKLGAVRMRDEDTMNTADQLFNQVATLRQNQAFTSSRDALKDYMDSRDSYYKDFQEAAETASAHLLNYLQNKAKTITFRLAHQYNMAPNSPDQVAVEEQLVAYATTLAEDFAVRGRSFGHAMMRGLGIMSRGMETGGATFGNVLYNIFSFITGPWTIMTIFAFIFFFFVLQFVGYNIQFLWIMPAIGAVTTVLLNFSDSFQPLDWVTHISSGAIMGYSAALLMIALGMPNWGFIGGSGTTTFWIIWLILGFIGLFQFYQNGGWKVVLQGGLIILLFAYLALGPYQAYFYQITDQVKAPIEIAYRAVERAITDVWLLATNPTEWYARQQVVNVRPERPLDVPKGIELSTIEALPASVPAGQQFALTTVIKNEGVLDAATDIIISLDCNQWCVASFATPTTSEKMDDAARARLGPLAKQIDDGKLFYIKNNLRRGESTIITTQPFVALSMAQRAAETNFARVKFNLSYIYYTNSSLQVSVISQTELQRKFRENEPVFKPVVAVSKGTPAQLSLNVGPQPLQAGSPSILLISVSNSRDDSKVILQKDSKIIITMPKTVGSGLDCNGYKNDKDNTDTSVEIVKYNVNPASGDSIEILANEFQSIFAFICTFTAATDVETLRTDLVTASLPQYMFRLEQHKDVPITPPLGILFEPFESTCNAASGIDACHAITASKGKAGDPARTCYYEYYGTLTLKDPLLGIDVLPKNIISSSCHVCGSVADNCGKFQSNETCQKEASVCGWNCAWEFRKDPVSGVDSGVCKNSTVTAGGIIGPMTDTQKQIAQKIIQIASEMKSNAPNADQQVKAEGIANSFEEMVLKVAVVESSLRHCTDGSLGCVNDNTYGSTLCSSSSCGIMQINVLGSTPAHPDWKTSTNEYGCNGKGAYDLDCNIRLGVGLLIKYYGDYGQNGNPNPICETYKDQYIAYKGWKAALRAYNGWGCPQSYLGGQAAAAGYVEKVVKTTVSVSSITQGNYVQQDSYGPILDSGWSINSGQKGYYQVYTLGIYNVRVGVVDTTQTTVMLVGQIKNMLNNQWVAMDCSGHGILTNGGELYAEFRFGAQNVELGCDVKNAVLNEPNPSGNDFTLKIASVDNSAKTVALTVEPVAGNAITGNLIASAKDCVSCTSGTFVWCTAQTPSQSSGACSEAGPCAGQYSNPVLSTDQCPGQVVNQQTSGSLVADAANHMKFYSNSLEEDKFYNIYLPPSYNTNIDKRYPVVYLLNGLWGDESAWIDKGNIVNIYKSLLNSGKIKEMIIVMPDGDNSAYENGCSGGIIFSCGNYENYIVSDLINEIDSKYRTIANKDGRAIGGLSLGARGAMRLAFIHTDLFSSVAGHSGRYDYLIDEMTAADWNRVKTSGMYIYFDASSNDLIPYYTSSSEQLDGTLTIEGIQHEFHLIDYPTLQSHAWPFWQQQVPIALVGDCNKICTLA
ncbi:MAG: alpha/beta hydrolase-fold protein, partial [Candidatus Aenigmarchaeota archaeon]|nr:alpha/beta hydrolase-fold protein [Candidatus Aenigmarchaeota archaeon]